MKAMSRAKKEEMKWLCLHKPEHFFFFHRAKARERNVSECERELRTAQLNAAKAREQNGLLVTFCQRVIENFYCKTS